MADTPENPSVKRTKQSADKPVKAKPVKGPVMAKAATPVKTATIKTSADRKASAKPGNGAASHGWAAQIAPLKEQAEKAVKSAAEQIAPYKDQAEKVVKAAAEKLGAVDWKAQIDPIKDQAGKTAKSAADTAKVKTGSAMASLAKLITDTAGTVDAKLGPQYGDYARQAAESVANAANTLDSKDVDQLLTEAKDFVRKSPAVAIGAAAVVGFVLMRLAKGSGDDEA